MRRNDGAAADAGVDADADVGSAADGDEKEKDGRTEFRGGLKRGERMDRRLTVSIFFYLTLPRSLLSFCFVCEFRPIEPQVIDIADEQHPHYSRDEPDNDRHYYINITPVLTGSCRIKYPKSRMRMERAHIILIRHGYLDTLIRLRQSRGNTASREIRNSPCWKNQTGIIGCDMSTTNTCISVQKTSPKLIIRKRTSDDEHT